MLLIVGSTTISAIILFVFWLKSHTKSDSDQWFPPNEDLEKYYTLENTPLNKQKQLTLAASKTLQRIAELDEEKDYLYELTQNRIISFDLWDKYERTVNDLELERLNICGEADSIKEDFSSIIFRDADALNRKANKHLPKRNDIEESIFNKRREVLEKKVVLRLGLESK